MKKKTSNLPGFIFPSTHVNLSLDPNDLLLNSNTLNFVSNPRFSSFETSIVACCSFNTITSALNLTFVDSRVRRYRLSLTTFILPLPLLLFYVGVEEEGTLGSDDVGELSLELGMVWLRSEAIWRARGSSSSRRDDWCVRVVIWDFWDAIIRVDVHFMGEWASWRSASASRRVEMCFRGRHPMFAT